MTSEDGPFRPVSSTFMPGGSGTQYDAEDWDRAIRHGVGVGGTARFAIPSGP